MSTHAIACQEIFQIFSSGRLDIACSHSYLYPVEFLLGNQAGVGLHVCHKKIKGWLFKNALLNSEIRFWQSCWVADEQLEIIH